MKFLDTTSKVAEAPAGQEMVCVCGFFDPLLAAHVRLLAQQRVPGMPLAVCIVDPPQPLLPLADRARVVAALSMVDRVHPGVGAEGLIADAHLREEFLRRVRRRAGE
jgi:bifunctional ADP-heptose synthase (sugar kinase/adenylyltransferase)